MASRYGREGDSGDGGPWSNVQYRKNRKSKGDGIEWTFLVQNLSDRVSRNVLWRSFQPFRFISDVYVARKRDARGKCFGFVRFVGVDNMKDTLEKLNTIKMFDMKVVVSLAKYDKDHNRINYAPASLGRNVWRPKNDARGNVEQTHGGEYGGQPQVEKHVSANTPAGPSYVQEGRSYADLLKGNKGIAVEGAKVVSVEGKGSLYPLHCIGRSIVGYTKEVMSVGKVRLALEGEDMSEVGLSYVGGVTFMLTFKDKSTARDSMNSSSAFFQKKFSSFFLWNGEDIPFNRIAKINVVGVPFIIRDNSLFDRVGGLFGEVIQKSSFSWQNEDNSSGSVMVITEQKANIDEADVIKWNNKSIVVWASESIGQPPNIAVNELNMDIDDSELESDSDSDEDLVEEEVFEEGEVRPCGIDKGMDQDRYHDTVPEKEANAQLGDSGATPVEMEESTGVQGSQETEESPGINENMEKNDVHGEINLSAHGDCCNDAIPNLGDCPVPEVSYMGPVMDINNPMVGGSCGPNGQGFQPNYANGEDGPSPFINLAKRSREDRSPPSIGSIQGPSQRLFGQSIRSDSVV
ncbi:putative RNA recognition motif domain, nucleotide-binding alpha-beta plait domain superfamily [Helianthus anomalus]